MIRARWTCLGAVPTTTVPEPVIRAETGPLMAITTLESVLLPMQCKDVEFLRNHPGIKRISYKKITQPAEEFWKELDKAKPAAPAPPPPKDSLEKSPLN